MLTNPAIWIPTAYVLGYASFYRLTLGLYIKSDFFTTYEWRTKDRSYASNPHAEKRSSGNLDELTFTTVLVNLVWPLYPIVGIFYLPSWGLRRLTDRVANAENKQKVERAS